MSVSGSDTTVCTGCLPSHAFVADGSCQLSPAFNFTIRDRVSSYNYSLATYANVTFPCDTRLGTAGFYLLERGVFFD